MAKRRRLPMPGATNLDSGATSVSPEVAIPPIASVVGEGSAQAALVDLAEEMSAARAAGRMVLSVPLSAIEEQYLVRDRLGVSAEEMDSLVASLRARGQQTPIDVKDLGGGSYGLISGWRRMKALRRLWEETKEPRFAEVLCLVRQPDNSADAYVAMIEENEIRAGLSYYERAMVALRAAEAGAFPTARKAVSGLFASASRSKQSKIGSFLRICETLDPVLRHPKDMPERLGLALSRGLSDDPSLVTRAEQALRREKPATAAAEQRVLFSLLKNDTAKDQSPTQPTSKTVAALGLTGPSSGPDQITIAESGAQLILSGPGVTSAFRRDLTDWLEKRAQKQS